MPSRWARPAARRNASSRSRATAASSNRCGRGQRGGRGRAGAASTAAGVAGHGAADAGDDGGVGLDVLRGRCTARRSGPISARRHARAAGAGAGGSRRGALAQPERLVQGGDRQLGLARGAERPEVGGAVVADLAHDRQPGERLDGELDPGRALGEAGAPVVARLVLGDQPQLADLGLERWSRRRSASTALGEADHLGHPAALLGRR